MEFVYLAFTHMASESYDWWLGSLLYLRDVFRALIKSIVCWFLILHKCSGPHSVLGYTSHKAMSYWRMDCGSLTSTMIIVRAVHTKARQAPSQTMELTVQCISKPAPNSCTPVSWQTKEKDWKNAWKHYTGPVLLDSHFLHLTLNCPFVN